MQIWLTKIEVKLILNSMATKEPWVAFSLMELSTIRYTAVLTVSANYFLKVSPALLFNHLSYQEVIFIVFRCV